ncbi:MAG: hypothetical protein ACO24L_07735, partial [Polynucleobacter sp.]
MIRILYFKSFERALDKMTNPIPTNIQEQLFTQARTVHAFESLQISDEQISQLYELMKWGPTAFNAQPGRYVFVRSEA